MEELKTRLVEATNNLIDNQTVENITAYIDEVAKLFGDDLDQNRLAMAAFSLAINYSQELKKMFFINQSFASFGQAANDIIKKDPELSNIKYYAEEILPGVYESIDPANKSLTDYKKSVKEYKLQLSEEHEVTGHEKVDYIFDLCYKYSGSQIGYTNRESIDKLFKDMVQIIK